MSIRRDPTTRRELIELGEPSPSDGDGDARPWAEGSHAAPVPMEVRMRSTTTHHHRSTPLRRLALVAALLGGLAVAPALAPPAEAAIGGGFTDDLDGFDTARWYKADGYSNGGMFNAGWRADHVWHSGGVMGINLDNAGCPGGCSGKPYASGEYRSTDLYTYGRFETRMKAASGGSGTVSSFFTYTGPSDGQPWDEIDVEILGKNTRQVQLNYFTNGVGGHETVINLGFDAPPGTTTTPSSGGTAAPSTGSSTAPSCTRRTARAGRCPPTRSAS
ncbi:hypothetical protein Cch01nite_43310 [Cellulomonas chitinilytica]|uniref:Beta-glucanase n=1 Tax=Cellulomonas chitinilytica TaxID=398759 RepID=A0A919P571_9CELL|nr:hypothetical protein Cch01nite_43310 [Cellulomonas chitinilytica]